MSDSLTLEQRRALAIAEAQLKLQQQQRGPNQQSVTADWKPYTPSGESLGRHNLLSTVGQAMTSPRIAGGPMGMIMREGQRQTDEFMDKGAYAAGGAVTDVAAQAGASPEVAGGAGWATNVGVRAIPSVVGALVGKTVEPATKPLGRGLMQSALKPGSKELASGDAEKAVETMLQGGFNSTRGGVADMRAIVKAISADVDEMVAASKGTVNPDIARREIAEQLNRFASQANSNSDRAAILASWNEFKQNFPKSLSVQRAQEIKQGTYRVLADKYAHLGTVGDEAGTQAQMAIARGLRKGVEQQVPGVVEPNKRMSDLINAIEIAERRAGVAGNRDIAGLAWLAEHPVAAGGMLADRSQLVKSLLARYLYSGMPATGAAVGTVYGNYDDAMRERGQTPQRKAIIDALRGRE